MGEPARTISGARFTASAVTFPCTAYLPWTGSTARVRGVFSALARALYCVPVVTLLSPCRLGPVRATR